MLAGSNFVDIAECNAEGLQSDMAELVFRHHGDANSVFVQSFLCWLVPLLIIF